MKYIGIDHHKQYFIATVMDQEGKVIRKDRVSTDRRAVREYMEIYWTPKRLDTLKV